MSFAFGPIELWFLNNMMKLTELPKSHEEISKIFVDSYRGLLGYGIPPTTFSRPDDLDPSDENYDSTITEQYSSWLRNREHYKKSLNLFKRWLDAALDGSANPNDKSPTIKIIFRLARFLCRERYEGSLNNAKIKRLEKLLSNLSPQPETREIYITELCTAIGRWTDEWKEEQEERIARENR